MQELTTLMETHVDHNTRLREENNKMATQMTTLISQVLHYVNLDPCIC